MRRRIFVIILLLLALCLLIATPMLAFTSLGNGLLVSTRIIAPTATPSPTAIPPTPTPIPTPQPVLTVQGKPPAIAATASYLLDIDSGHVLEDIKGEKPLPMASTTKIMTALIAIQTGNLDQEVTIKQDAIDRVIQFNGSSAQLVVGDKIALKDLLYGLLLPSGDDAAVAIADALGGSSEPFVARMNLFAYHLHLFQTHYTNPDGLTPDGQTNPDHYTTAADLTRLAEYAMQTSLFAQIVRTQSYSLLATSQHHAYTWNTTNTLLTTYQGMLGIKTGHTEEAGYCLVFAAERNNHHLIGVMLHSADQDQRDKDATTLLDWAFVLPTLPPAY